MTTYINIPVWEVLKTFQFEFSLTILNMWWGFTPALDLLLEVNSREVNILSIGQCDFRHVIKTLAKKYTHANVSNVKICVYEESLDIAARSLLLLSIALEENEGLGKKSQQFIEIYGNTLLRPTTRQYLSDASTRLIKIVTNFNYAQNILPNVSLESLKYRDRDQLEHIFKFWSSNDDLDILNYWEQRERSLLGTRFDSRLGVYDWDLHMRYRPYGADIIATQEYNTFRGKGISFWLRDSDPCVANPTLATFPPGSKKPASGYFGDITTGPYAAYGLDSDEKSLLQKYNGLYRHSATDVSLWNVQQMFYEIEKQKPYQPPKQDAAFLGIRQDNSQHIRQLKTDWKKASGGDSYSACSAKNIEIIFLPVTALKEYPNKQQFQGFFDLVTVPQHFVPKLPENWRVMCKPNCKIVVESSKYILSLTKDALAKSKVETEELLKNAGGEVVGDFDYRKNDFMRFVIKQ